MLRSDFETRFEIARQRALKHPRWFRIRVTWRAFNGVMAVCIFTVAAVMMVGWSLAPAFDGDLIADPVPSLLRMLWVLPALWCFVSLLRVLKGHFPAPEGMRLDRAEAPRLFALLDRMARRFGTPPIHEVRVTGELNAAITQRPTLGYFFRLRNTLVLGLPLAFALSPRQFTAVIAHEFGHLRRQRMALGGWGCHLRAFWHQVLENMETVPSRLRPMLSWVSSHESPVYCAESLVLSHLDELEADAAAAEVVGSRRLGEALAEVAMKQRFLADDYWRKVYAQADRAKRPSILPYRNMAAAFRVGFDRAALVDELEDVGDEDDDEALSTHPSLQARIRALGLQAAEAGQGSDNAARRFFACALPRLTAALDRQWWDAERRSWRRRHWEVSRAMERIARLETEEDLDVSERLELAMLVERYGGERDAVSVYAGVLPHAQARPDALLAMGRLLVSRGDPAGVAYLRQALDEDDAVGLQAAALLVEHCERVGNERGARRYRKRLARILRQAALVQDALDLPLTALRNLPPGLEMFELRALVRELRQHDEVSAAYVARRRCELAPRWRAYLMVLCVPPAFLPHAELLAQQVETSISLCGLWRVMIVAENGEEERAMQRVRGAKFYSRKRRTSELRPSA